MPGSSSGPGPVETKKINGRRVAKAIEERVALKVEQLKERGITPLLVSLSVDMDDPSFDSYMRSRDKACTRVGIESAMEKVPLMDAERSLGRSLSRLAGDPAVHGILLQLPLPSGINEEYVLSRLDPHKDVEGIHPVNAGLLALGRPRFVPCTAAAVMEILRHEKIDLTGRHVVVLGRSKVVGAPLTSMLLDKRHGGNGTVTVCHSRTRNLPQFVAQADVLIAAIGQVEFVRGEWIRPDAVVIDVGTHWVEDTSLKHGGRLTGDVHFESAAPIASRITPVPGGVGPVTTALLLQASVRAAAGVEE